MWRGGWVGGVFERWKRRQGTEKEGGKGKIGGVKKEEMTSKNERREEWKGEGTRQKGTRQVKERSGEVKEGRTREKDENRAKLERK